MSLASTTPEKPEIERFISTNSMNSSNLSLLRKINLHAVHADVEHINNKLHSLYPKAAKEDWTRELKVKNKMDLQGVFTCLTKPPSHLLRNPRIVGDCPVEGLKDRTVRPIEYRVGEENEESYSKLEAAR